MFYRRYGIPEVDEIVLCKVTKIFPNSVFVDILEYRQQGMVHISEVSPGRIRNLREFVTVDRQIVCKVLRIDREQGHIDLSLRRVNSTQRQEKLEEIKQELKAEGLISNLAKKLKLPAEQLYKTVAQPVFKDYSHLYLCFKGVVDAQVDLEKVGIEKTIAAELTTAIIDKFKPAKIFLKGEIRLQTYDSQGVDKIKSTLHAVEVVSPTILLSYLGAGRYKLTIEDFDYKPAEQTFRKVQEIIEQFVDPVSTSSIEREKTE